LSAPTQINRPFRVKFGSLLGDDALLLDSFVGVERVSDPFRFVLRLLSSNPNVDMQSLLTKPAVLTLSLPGSAERHIHGNICRMKLLEEGSDGMAAYEAEVVPWFWFLTLFSDCRIFQNMSVPDIVEKVFKDRGFFDFRPSLKGAYNPREYCVQYRETDFNFVSRLLEEEGIFYFFEHTADKHTMVLADDVSAFAVCPNQPDRASVAYSPSTGGRLNNDVVFALEAEYRVQTGKASLADYDFTKPNFDLFATLAGKQQGEAYDYPGKYQTKDDGDHYARVRLEEMEVGISTVRGASNCMGFQSGYKFTLTGHYRVAANIDYTLLMVEHSARNTSYRAGQMDPFEYRNRFEAIPNSVPYHPARRARKPRIEGTQTAVVVGQAGEEIWTDQYGRVVVQFFWDRQGTDDQNSSCWIRVAQGWAGKQWGFICIPRIGQEVVVSFLEGDPDRPLITGSVYNADQMPPYTLPAYQTKSTWKSMSSKGGGFNELRFEDSKGSEQIFLHAEKDLHLRTKNDRYETILNNTNLNVTKDQFEQVGGDSHVHVKGDQNIKIDGTYSLNSGQDHQEKAGTNFAVEAGTELHLKAGTNLVIESGVSLTLKVGGSFINLMSAGVFISGPMVYINSGGSAGSAGAANPTAPTDPTDAVDADPGAVTSPPSSQAQTPASMSLQDISPAAASAPAAAAPATPPAGAAPGPEDDVALPVAPKDSTAAGMAAGLQQAAQSGAAFCET
jgi:type VI secretion system secreted protein VgrG